MLFKWLIVPVVIFVLGWLYRIELLQAARILEHSVAWGLLSIVPVVLAWGVWKVARCLWGRSYKRAAFLSGTSGCVVIGYIALNIVAPFVCDKEIDAALRRMPPPGAQIIYAKRGAGYERVILPLDRRINADEIRQSALFLAVPAIEDERFFGRITGPLDPEALLRAAVHNVVMKRKGQQGGSTILVQAAKMVQGKWKSSLGDKPYQFLLALRLNQRFPMDEEQLALYLNLAQLDGPHGVAYAASNFYGVASLSELKLTEPSGIAASALLAGMLKEPPKYHPRRHPQYALDRRNLVLQKMHKAGVFEDLVAMQALPLNVRESPRVTTFDFFARAQRRNKG
jgi:membrane peptidoglycan carboxypeptidase